MERVTGAILRARPPAGVTLDADTMHRISSASVRTLAAIHALDYEAAGLAGFGKPAGYVERQVAGWRTRYAQAQTDEIAEIDRLGEWLERHQPPEASPALVHNDYKYDNLVLDPADLGRIVAVLDWEMATIGDSRLDVGSSLAYWADRNDPPWWRQQAMTLTTLDGNLDRRGFVDAYAAASGREMAHPVFCYAYGLLKLATIVQQIYGRYRRGTATDPRFAPLGEVVRTCGRMAARAIERNRIHNLG
jgi:aminoglycoside phosphotransferase (APT) family kinase protein